MQADVAAASPAKATSVVPTFNRIYGCNPLLDLCNLNPIVACFSGQAQKMKHPAIVDGKTQVCYTHPIRVNAQHLLFGAKRVLLMNADGHLLRAQELEVTLDYLLADPQRGRHVATIAETAFGATQQYIAYALETRHSGHPNTHAGMSKRLRDYGYPG